MKIQWLLGSLCYKGPPGTMERYPWNTPQQTQEHTTHFETPITPWFIRERSDRALSWDSVGFHSCALFFTCVCGLAEFVLLCVFLLLPLLLFVIVIILCKEWETPTCGDSSQKGTYDKEDNCGTQVWSLDYLRGVECNPRPLGCHNLEAGLDGTTR